jgi:hypothetical protein
MSIQGMEVRDKILGREDDKTLEVMELIGGVYLDQGQWDIAEKLQLEVMETYKKKLGTDHLDTLTSTFILAYKWHRSGNKAKAIEVLEGCIQSSNCVLGPNHSTTLLLFQTLTIWKAEEEHITISPDVESA